VVSCPAEWRRPGRGRGIFDVKTKRAAQAPDKPAKDDGEIGARGRLITLEEGIHALSFAPAAPAGAAGGVKLPVIHVGAPPSDDYDMVEIVTGSGDLPEWCDGSGGVVVVKVPAGGGVVMVTAFGLVTATEAVAVDVRRLGPGAPMSADPPAPVLPARAPSSPAAPIGGGAGYLRSEILLHIEREGDRRFESAGWAGTRGQRRRVEAFSVCPLETLTPGDVQYKAFGPNGRETPWVSDAKLCGTRGRGIPLTGFAVRIAPHLQDRFDVVYEGAFFDSGVTGTMRNGEPCVPTVKDDPLEAINLRVVPHGAG
jgi:hypothetical protein